MTAVDRGGESTYIVEAVWTISVDRPAVDHIWTQLYSTLHDLPLWDSTTYGSRFDGYVTFIIEPEMKTASVDIVLEADLISMTSTPCYVSRSVACLCSIVITTASSNIKVTMLLLSYVYDLVVKL